MEIEEGKFICTKLGEYAVLKTLGEGATSKIKLGQKENGEFYALKILKDAWNLQESGCKNEVEILQKL